MKKIAFISLGILFACATNINAQAIQEGVVLEYHGEKAKTPLSRVSVTATNASSTISDNAGKFTLNFRSLKAGDKIQFRRIEKAGYEVMNTEAIEAMRIGRNKEDKPLEIILCKSDELNKLRDGYRSVAVQRYAKQLESKKLEIERLKKEGKIKDDEFNSELSKAEDEYEDKLSHMEMYIDRFARIDLSAIDDEEKAIIALVQEGKIDEAIAKYDDLKLTEKLKQTLDDKRKLQSAHDAVSKAEDEKSDEVKQLNETNERIKKELNKHKK